MIGKNMQDALYYYARHEIWGFAPFWSGYDNKEPSTKRAINSLVKLGLLETNEYFMAHVTTTGLWKAKELGLV